MVKGQQAGGAQNPISDFGETDKTPERQGLRRCCDASVLSLYGEEQNRRERGISGWMVSFNPDLIF